MLPPRRVPPLLDAILIATSAGAFALALALARAEEKPQAPARPPAAGSPTAQAPSSAAPQRVPAAEGQAAIQKFRAGDRAPLARMAEAGDPDAQAALGNLLFEGAGGKPDYRAARQWYEKAAAQGHPQAKRTLGEMYAKGQGGKKDAKKARQLWIEAEQAGDRLAPILVADQMFTEIAGRPPGPGQYAFRGGIPVADVEVAIDWYEAALKRDLRPEVKARAEMGLTALKTFKAAAQVNVETRKTP